MGSVNDSRLAMADSAHAGFPSQVRLAPAVCRSRPIAVVSPPMALKPGKLLVALAIHLALPGAQAVAGDAVVAPSSLQYMPLSHFVDVTSLEGLADMVVTDTKVAQSPDSVTQAMVVLRSDEIERQPIYNRNLAEMMRYTSGQFVNVLSRNHANWGSYAGLGPKYNTWLLDGLPIDSFVDPMSLDVSAIERIEVQKGPASVLYANYLTMDFAGNETPLAGTTNLILKNRVDTPLTRFSAGYGSFGTWQGSAYHQGRAGGLSFVLGAGGEQTDYTQYSTAQTVKNPEYDKYRLFANLGYDLGRPGHSVALFLHHTRHDGDEGRPNRDFRNSYDTVNFTYNNQLAPDWNLQFKAGERRYDRESGNDNYPTSLASTGHDLVHQTLRPLDVTLSWLHAGNGLLTAGMDHQTVDYETANRASSGVEARNNVASARSTGFFVQEKVQWQEWVFRAGLRHNSIEHDNTLLGGAAASVAHASWSKNLWSLGARYNASPSLALYANMGSSFITPTAKQIGGTIAESSGADGQKPNPGLQPESGIGSDLGFDWHLNPATRLSLRAFLNKVDNAIVENVISDQNPSQSRSINLDRTTAQGMEAEVRHTPSETLALFANLTRTHTVADSPGNANLDGTAIPFVPDLVCNLGATVQLPGQWRISPYAHWVGRYYDGNDRTRRTVFGNYGVLNLRLQKTLRPGAEFTLDLSNLGNRRFEMPWGFQDPGFQAFAGVSFSL